MKKRSACRQRVTEVLDDREGLERLLLRESGLPGRRANLELAAAFADVIEEQGVGGGRQGWLLDWAELTADQAPTNDPHEYLPFVATQALGASYPAARDGEREIIEQTIRAAACDRRWRLHEAAAFALQRIGEQDWAALEPLVTRLEQDPSLLAVRAALVALAHPPLLDHAQAASFALAQADRLFERFAALGTDDRKAPTGQVLRKALQFAPSVIVAAAPVEGFGMLSRWAGSDDLDIKRIVAANLRKARLARHFPDQVEDVGVTLSETWE
jgi:hypothetical protein